MNEFTRAEALRQLSGGEGSRLLAEAEVLPADRLTRLSRLRRRYSVDLATAGVELLELRRRARAKFAHAETMWFTPEGLEQSTGEAVARYRSARFPAGVPVLDACCGIGGDALALAERGLVIAADRNPAAVVCTRLNAVLPPSAPYPIHALCADVVALSLERMKAGGVGAAFLDPSRRATDIHGARRRTRDADAYSPPLAWAETLMAHFPATAVKVSPALDDSVLRRFPARVEFVSDQGECKEAVLWFGPLAESLPAAPGGAPFATVLRRGCAPATLLPFACETPPPTAPRAWLYEPDPAVIRAHLIAQVAHLLNASQLDPQIAYLTADALLPTPFAVAYRVLDWLPFHLKNVQARLRALGRRVVAVKRRGVPLEPEEMRKRLAGTSEAGDPPAVVVLCRRADRPIAVLCEPPEPLINNAT